jgi:drug/metabolite transporter (DMT)-like permease
MVMSESSGSGLTWLVFALMTVGAWGLYGVFLHQGQMGMADPAQGRYKAFLFVGLAYFLTAVLAPLVLLWITGASWQFPVRGALWSLAAGIVGAVGAFAVLLAFGARGTPAVVMSIVFAGAPVVNALAAMAWHPPRGGLGAVRWQFLAGILLAALGGFLVSRYRPDPGPPPSAHPPAAAPVATPRTPP